MAQLMVGRTVERLLACTHHDRQYIMEGPSGGDGTFVIGRLAKFLLKILHSKRAVLTNYVSVCKIRVLCVEDLRAEPPNFSNLH